LLVNYFFQLVAFLFVPVFVPFYLLALPFVAFYFFCRRKCFDREPTFSIADLLQDFWSSKLPASDVNQEFLENVSRTLRLHLELELERQMAAYFQRFNLRDLLERDLKGKAATRGSTSTFKNPLHEVFSEVNVTATSQL